MKWLITNKKYKAALPENSLKTNLYNIYIDDSSKIRSFPEKSEKYLLIDGYVLASIFQPTHVQTLYDYDLVFYLFKKYSYSFIDHVKGYFNIIIIENESIRVYGDRFAVKKFLYYYKDRTYIIGNDLESFPKFVFSNFNSNSFYLHCLFHHLIDGATFFENLKSNTIGLMLHFGVAGLTINKYFDLGDLQNQKCNIKIEDFAFLFHNIINQYLNYSDAGNTSGAIAHSITGGSDSRLILASLLKSNVNVHLYTYGSLNSQDQIISRDIANGLQIPFSSIEIDNYSQSTFKEDFNQVLSESNGLANFYRTFRFRAISKYLSKQQFRAVVNGFMGGEGIRGYGYNNYYESGILKDTYQSKNLTKKLIKEYLQRCFVNIPFVPEDFYDYVLKMPLLNHKNKDSGHFHFIYEVIGAMHHTPDITFSFNRNKNTINPYMDFDYLTVLFNSEYSFLRNKSLLKPHYYNRFYFSMIRSLYPELLKFPLTNGIRPDNYLSFAPVAIVDYLMKRRQPKHPNFEYNSWFRDFIIDDLLSTNSEVIKNIVNVESLLLTLKHTYHKNNESYWHRFSNTALASFVFNKYYNLKS
jgi:hypothetical protein